MGQGEGMSEISLPHSPEQWFCHLLRAKSGRGAAQDARYEADGGPRPILYWIAPSWLFGCRERWPSYHFLQL